MYEYERGMLIIFNCSNTDKPVHVSVAVVMGMQCGDGAAVGDMDFVLQQRRAFTARITTDQVWTRNDGVTLFFNPAIINVLRLCAFD